MEQGNQRFKLIKPLRKCVDFILLLKYGLPESPFLQWKYCPNNAVKLGEYNILFGGLLYMWQTHHVRKKQQQKKNICATSSVRAKNNTDSNDKTE